MSQTSAQVPMRPITSAPGYHWFGYYDKHQFDPAGRRVLAMAVDFEGRSPEADDVIRVGYIDLADGDAWHQFGETRAWCWQQGCMLQWMPGTEGTVIWNDRIDGRFVCHVLDVESGASRIVPAPVYSLAPDGRTAVAPDFRRVNEMRPGYGYTGLPDPCRDKLAPAESGVWRVNLEMAKTELAIAIADVLDIPWERGDYTGAKHYFNHLLFNPDGSRFVFLHRWRTPNGAWETRMLTACPDGSDIRVVDDNGFTSHFIWRDPGHILAYSDPDRRGRGFYLFDQATGEHELVMDIQQDGHCGYLPGGEWIVNDSYPYNDAHLQELYLYHVPTGRRVDLGKFAEPEEYKGEWRCDLHPRVSRDGRYITIDSVHEGNGRQIYLLDVSEIVGR